MVDDDGKEINVFVLEKKKPAASSAAAAATSVAVHPVHSGTPRGDEGGDYHERADGLRQGGPGPGGRRRQEQEAREARKRLTNTIAAAFDGTHFARRRV
mmetsp:Transcript_54113/g.166511  ORF Transcript_54113/g.166511 Transcript_54113/m.166511 type:complete len:99 (-) Transcript_54113:290-586(-)